MKIECPECSTVCNFSDAAQRANPARILQCLSCGAVIPQGKHAKTRRVSDNQKRSRHQERRAAKRYGGKVQPASGALRGAKSDIRKKGVLRGECKFTRARSFSLKLDELLKLEKEARGIETALFEVEFQGVYPAKRFVILSEKDFLVLKAALEEVRGDTDG